MDSCPQLYTYLTLFQSEAASSGDCVANESSWLVLAQFEDRAPALHTCPLYSLFHTWPILVALLLLPCPSTFLVVFLWQTLCFLNLPGLNPVCFGRRPPRIQTGVFIIASAPYAKYVYPST